MRPTKSSWPRLAPLLTAAALLCSWGANALPDDRNQAINLSSDKATYENNQGIYSGNVMMSQGSLQIEADQLVIVEDNRRVTKVIAHGTPARFQQQPRPGEGVVVASANTIEYKLQDEEILLQRDASITHQGSKISGDRVVYSGKRQTVVADGGTSTENNRVRMTLQPLNSNGEISTGATDSRATDSESAAKITTEPTDAPAATDKEQP